MGAGWDMDVVFTLYDTIWRCGVSIELVESGNVCNRDHFNVTNIQAFKP